ILHPSFPPLTGTMQSNPPVVDRYLLSSASNSFCRGAQSILFFISIHWQALHHPLSSNPILGLVDMFKQCLHQKTFCSIYLLPLDVFQRTRTLYPMSPIIVSDQPGTIWFNAARTDFTTRIRSSSLIPTEHGRLIAWRLSRSATEQSVA